MNWIDKSAENAGKRVYESEDAENPGHTYVIQRGMGMWRLAFREADDQALRIIYVGLTMRECQDYAETYKWST